MQDPIKPYNDLPPLPPAVEIETKAVLKACIEARAALAGVNEAMRLLPNATVLINSLPLLESQASSEIENIVTTTDALFRQAGNDGASSDPATKEALRYRTALRVGCESLATRPVCTATAVDICRVIKHSDLDIRRVPGTALAAQGSGQIIYTPPEGEALLRDKLANWERFVRGSTDLDPLVRMALAHYQFEAIHPFTDGNGRTGRILNLLILIDAGLLDLPILYLSGHILRSRDDYYRLLLAVTRDEAWEAWTLYMLDIVHRTADWTIAKIHAVRELMRSTRQQMQAQHPGLYSRELAELIFVQPYCRIQNVVDAGIAQRQTASSYLRELSRSGLLREEKVGRDKLFVNDRFLALLQRDETLTGSAASRHRPAG